MLCPHCHHDTCLVVCEQCHQIVPTRKSMSGRVTACARCGEINAADFVFCSGCGHKRSAIAAASPRARRQKKPASPSLKRPSPAAQIHACRQCHQEIARRIDVCPFCVTDCRPLSERVLTAFGQVAVAAAFLLIAIVPLYLYVLPMAHSSVARSQAVRSIEVTETAASPVTPPVTIRVSPAEKPPRARSVVSAAVNIPADRSQSSSSEVKQQIETAIEQWIASFQSRNVNEHVAFYAPRLTTYFTWHNVKHDAVVKDKRRFFADYCNIALMNLHDVSVSEVAPGIAEATFIKDWDVAGRGQFSGSVLQRLRFERQNGKWLITSEEELRTLKRHKTRGPQLQLTGRVFVLRIPALESST